MYRDEPLDDEAELRELVGDAPVDELHVLVGVDGVAATIDAMRLLQGWVDDAAARTWLLGDQRRLGDRSPLTAIAQGAAEDVSEVLRAWLAAQS
jgi:hypothetical protein